MYRHLGWVRGVVLLVCLAVCSTGCTWRVNEGDVWSFTPKHGDEVQVVMEPSFNVGLVETAQRCFEAGGSDYWYDPSTLDEVCSFYVFNGK